MILALQSFSFFKKIEEFLKDENWYHFAQICEFVEFEPLEPICRVKDRSTHVYLVLSGKVAVSKDWKKSYAKESLESEAISQLIPGATLGELGVVYNSRRYGF